MKDLKRLNIIVGYYLPTTAVEDKDLAFFTISGLWSHTNNGSKNGHTCCD